ncbi:protein of unknown function DUF460 [Pyrolobus fumarii 1A]|uniref:DUF460 domain-containing protein n=1 Tax=Pyrolobus fumarii (strain DSM 11204 / 1A) TaxID=694429 RepID=G0EEI1_PYRF1|nr:DUF460 domain-containing protein [Pyrolobus fumarii]AEM38022.1 protein of unknown function DUF460 [Pyrolobus fumarii 1A]
MQLNSQASGRGRSVEVIGFDVQPGGLFAVVGIDSAEKLVFKQEDVTLARLIRLVWEYRPRLLACDNIFELSEDESLLRKVLSMLPDETEVVQVTRNPDGSFVDLRSLALLAGIRVEGKLSPSKTAYLVAVLAKRGFGSRVAFTEEKTKIIIARARHGSSGGMSQARYQRGVKASILRATRIIKKLLDKHGFDYDLIFRKSGYGLESAVFIVYAPRSALYGIIRRFKGRDLRIEIRPVYTGRVVFESIRDQQAPRRYLIVGVDPGIVTGVAAVDLHGNPVFVYSRKGLDRAEIIELVKRHGEPVLIATDVTPPPETVKKLASSLGVPLYTPPYSLTVDEKQELVASISSRLSISRLNAHERDALAAALRAYREYSSKFRQIESTVAKYPAEISIDNLKATVLKGLTIAEALEAEIERILVEEPPKPVKSVRHTQKEQQHQDVNNETISKLQEELEAARARIQVLEKKLQECIERSKHLENEARLAKLEAASKAEEKLVEYKYRIESLQHELEKLRKHVEELTVSQRRMLELMRSVAMGVKALVPAVKGLNKTSLRRLMNDPLYWTTRVIYLHEPGILDESVLVQLVENELVAILAPETIPQNIVEIIKANNIPVILLPPDRVIVKEDIAIVDTEVLEEAILEKLRIDEELRKRSTQENNLLLDADSLRRLVEAYRRERYATETDEEVG